MRHIRKSASDNTCLVNRSAPPPRNPVEAKKHWQRYRHKRNLIKQLSQEQNGLCAYTEIQPNEHSLGSHLDHVEPRSISPARTFDYFNLVVSALGNEDLRNIQKEHHFGGHAKADTYDQSLFISSLDANCTKFFFYLSDGRVVPTENLSKADKKKADYTIKVLNLNSPYLVNRRQRWIKEIELHIYKNLHDSASLLKLANYYLSPTSNGQLRSFYSAAAHRLKPFLSS